jgi:hypothetical protein
MRVNILALVGAFIVHHHSLDNHHDWYPPDHDVHE